MTTIPPGTESGSTLVAATELAGRCALAALFLLAGIGKISGYEGTAAYMSSMGVPALLLPLVIALEVGGAVAVIAGFQAKLTALALAGFSLASAVLFHNNLGDQTQFIMFWKNVGLAGGFLLLAVHGAGPFSVDARRAGPATRPR